ncbi:MAG: alanine dehydrogenase [Candidatus Gastranaerophilales bacterium]|nr:alanine dehydrogenase [Candidatus Gastranaerophilales bacterium]
MRLKSVFGVPKELKEDEKRVALTPDTIKILTDDKYEVYVEKDAGILCGFTNEMYLEAGAVILDTKEEIWDKANIIVKVKEPQKEEYPLFREDQIIFSYMHLAVEEELVKHLLKSKVCAICAESVKTKTGEHPLLRPMSEVAGRLSIQLGAHYLEQINGGQGVLLGGVPGVRPGKVVILGAGVVGTNAAKVALGMGADVSVLDINSKRLADLDLIFNGSIKTHYCNPTTILEEAKKADILVTAVLKHDKKAPVIIKEETVKQMKKGSFLIDVAIDQGGNVETMDRTTTLTNPVFEKYGVLHCAIPNIPSLVPRTSSFAYSYAILPYIKQMAELGSFMAIRDLDTLSSGVNTFRGAVCNPELAQIFDLEHTELSLLVGFKVK